MNTVLTRALEGLPHGPEFRFVDRLTSLEPGRHGSGEYQLRGDEPFLRGHFPDCPLMPGVLLVEAAAQLAGSVAQCDPEIPPFPELRLTAIRHAKILGSARPGDRLDMEVRIQARLGSLIQAQALVSVAGHIVCQADLVLSGGRTEASGASP